MDFGQEIAALHLLRTHCFVEAIIEPRKEDHTPTQDALDGNYGRLLEAAQRTESRAYNPVVS
jgi:hypothetical protein